MIRGVSGVNTHCYVSEERRDQMMLLVGLRGVLSCLAHCCGPAMAQSRVAHGSKAAAVTALQKQAMESESTREQSQGLKD